jgi:Collagen triple helix repeat (20 copies)
MRRLGHGGDSPTSGRRMSYANVVATMALVLAIGGGTAWAAHHYAISSTNQIAPSVLKKLHGANGKRGTAGVKGTRGTAGADGANGTSGTAGANGTNGTNGAIGSTGAAGANGAVAGYSAFTALATNFSVGTNTLILSKALPAGNYILTGSVTFLAVSTAVTTQAEVACTLADPLAGAATDTSSYTGLTNVVLLGVDSSVNSLSMNVAVNATAANTAKITCSDVFNTGNAYQVASQNASITAVQTTSNS